MKKSFIYDKMFLGDEKMFYKINHGSITLGTKTILKDINFCVRDKEKIGIVGRNGEGKTSLLKAITEEYEMNDGYEKITIESSHDFKIGYVKQNDNIDKNVIMLDYIKYAYRELLDIVDKIEKLELRIAKDYDEKLLNKYNSLLESFEYLGGYTYMKEIDTALKKFGFNDDDKSKKLSEFSGGQLTKLFLIKLILSNPDLLILDEPTNHLDINAIEWLENYLKNYKNSVIVVSHDRMFLDNVCNVIYNISCGTLKRYSGNYSAFLKAYKEEYNKNLKDYEFQQKEIKRLQAIADRFRYKPTKAKMAMSKLKQIERMTIIDKPNKENTRTFKINFAPIMESYFDVLKIKNLSIGYNQPFCSINLELERGDKLGIIGENGVGKSTLIKTLIGEVEPLGGKFVFGKNTKIAYFSQNLDNLDVNNTIYEEIENSYSNMTSNEIRSLLGAFNFTGDEVFKRIGDLSGGEKVRVSLCKILNDRCNVLILDEPTNHLDIINKDTIEKMLTDYQGTVIVVSHDRYLIKEVCNKLLVLSNGESTLYKYGYSEYEEKKKEFSPGRKVENVKVKKVVSYNVKKEINKIENDIIRLEGKLKYLNDALLKKEVYTDIKKYNDVQKEIGAITSEIDNKTSMWDNLTKDI